VNDFPFSANDDVPNRFVKLRLDRFLKDLRILQPREVVRKHILMGDCYILNHDEYYDLCARISDQFKIIPQHMHLVGSGKLGFSIAENKRYRPFNPESDIDIAIVSPELFDKIWMEVARFNAQEANWKEKGKFRRYLMDGWIRPDALPISDSFQTRKEWWPFFQGLTSQIQNGKFRVSAGLYRTEAFLELYQEKSVKSCKADLELKS
jgi:hypothetical protein